MSHIGRPAHVGPGPLSQAGVPTVITTPAAFLCEVGDSALRIHQRFVNVSGGVALLTCDARTSCVAAASVRTAMREKRMLDGMGG